MANTAGTVSAETVALILTSFESHSEVARRAGTTRQTVTAIRFGQCHRNIHPDLPRWTKDGPKKCELCAHWQHGDCTFRFPEPTTIGTHFAHICINYLASNETDNGLRQPTPSQPTQTQHGKLTHSMPQSINASSFEQPSESHQMFAHSRNRKTNLNETGVFVWSDDDPNASLGPGLSRPMPNEVTKPWRLRVKLPAQPAMTVTLQAATKAKAIKYTTARWPQSTVTVL